MNFLQDLSQNPDEIKQCSYNDIEMYWENLKSTMTANGSPPEPPTNEGMRGMIVKGVIGAISLAGATAIPIIVKQHLEPTPAVSPSPSASAQIAPAQMVPAQLDPTQIQSESIVQDGKADDDKSHDRGGKKKGKNKD